MKAPALTLFFESSLSLIGFIVLFTLLGMLMSPKPHQTPSSSQVKVSQMAPSLSIITGG
jgi:hypothetical protein